MSAASGTGGEDGDGDGTNTAGEDDAGRGDVDDPADHAPYNATAVLEYLMTPRSSPSSSNEREERMTWCPWGRIHSSPDR